MLTAALHVKCNSKKGRYLNDVRMGRWEVGTQKADDSTDKLRGCHRDKWGGEGGGAKIPEILRTSFKYDP